MRFALLILLIQSISICVLHCEDTLVSMYALDTSLTARSQSTGNLLKATVDDVNSLIVNPAGLAFAPYSELGIFRNTDSRDIQSNTIIYLHPLKKSGLGIGFTTYNGGQLDVNEECLVLGLGKEVMPDISIGASGRLLRSTLLERYQSETFVFDAGALWNPLDSRLSMGILFKNLGASFNSDSVNEYINGSMELGMGINISDTRKHNCTIGGGFNWDDTENTIVGNIGMEYIREELFALRVSYRLDPGLFNSFAAGFGFSVGKNRIDYSWSNPQSGNYLNQVSLSCRFGSSDSFSKGVGYYKKEMFDRAYKYLKKVPRSHSQYVLSQTLSQRCSGKSADADMQRTYKPGLAQVPVKYLESSERFPVDIRVMKDIPTAVYNLFPQRGIVPILLDITNNSDKEAEFKVVYRYEPKSIEQETVVKVDSHNKMSVSLYPMVSSSLLSKVKKGESQVLRISIYYISPEGELKKLREDFTEYVLFHPCNRYFTRLNDALGRDISLVDTISAWITFDDIALIKVIAKAGKRGAKQVPPIKIVGSQDKRVFERAAKQIDSDFIEQIELIYNTLIEDYKLMYVNQPIATSNGELLVSQRVKFPSQTLKYGGNCIELSVLFASLLESIGIDPIIMLLPNDGHCVVGWEIQGTDKPTYRILETNYFGQDFDKVMDEASAWIYKYNFQNEFNNGIDFGDDGIYMKNNDVIILSIKKLRSCIPPSPYSNE